MWKHVLYGAAAFWFIQFFLFIGLYEAGWMSLEENQIISEFVVGWELLLAMVGLAVYAIGDLAWLSWDLLRHRLRSCTTTAALIAILACFGFARAAAADLLLPVHVRVTAVTSDSVIAVVHDSAELRFPRDLISRIHVAPGDSLELRVEVPQNIIREVWKMDLYVSYVFGTITKDANYSDADTTLVVISVCERDSSQSTFTLKRDELAGLTPGNEVIILVQQGYLVHSGPKGWEVVRDPTRDHNELVKHGPRTQE